MPQYMIRETGWTINLPFRVASLESGTCSEIEAGMRWTFCGLHYRTKEPDTIAWIDAMQAGVLWDIGANVGVYTLYALSRHVGLYVVAIEPDPANAKALRDNIAINEYGDRAMVVEAAIAEQDGSVNLRIQVDQVGRSGSVSVDPKPGEQLVGVRSINQGELLALPRPHYLKIDVDGGELSVVKKILGIISSDDIMSILIEANDPSIGSYLCGLGYRLSEEHLSLRRRGSRNEVYHRWASAML